MQPKILLFFITCALLAALTLARFSEIENLRKNMPESPQVSAPDYKIKNAGRATAENNLNETPSGTVTVFQPEPVTEEKTGEEKNAPIKSAPATSAIQIPRAIISSSINLSLASSSPAQAPSKFIPEQREIDPQSIAGLVCQFRYSFTNPLSQKLESGEVVVTKGSGVVIDNRGYILTNKHIVSKREGKGTLKTTEGDLEVDVTYAFDYCRAGFPPPGSSLPDASLIRSYNPSLQIPVLAYKAKLAYLPSEEGLSETESAYNDFALLKIIGLGEDASTFGVKNFPSVFHSSPLLSTSYLSYNDQLLTYGFPGDVTEGKKSGFETLYLTGGVGQFTGIKWGDLKYKEKPMLVTSNLEVSRGRSGSPLFWRGYVVGLVTAYEQDNKTKSFSIASDVIMQNLGTNGVLAR